MQDSEVLEQTKANMQAASENLEYVLATLPDVLKAQNCEVGEPKEIGITKIVRFPAEYGISVKIWTGSYGYRSNYVPSQYRVKISVNDPVGKPVTRQRKAWDAKGLEEIAVIIAEKVAKAKKMKAQRDDSQAKLEMAETLFNNYATGLVPRPERCRVRPFVLDGEAAVEITLRMPLDSPEARTDARAIINAMNYAELIVEPLSTYDYLAAIKAYWIDFEPRPGVNVESLADDIAQAEAGTGLWGIPQLKELLSDLLRLSTNDLSLHGNSVDSYAFSIREQAKGER